MTTWANWKPAKGSRTLELLQKRRSRRAAEIAVKKAAKLRDGNRCRWPRCPYQKDGVRIEAAHLTHKGAGGDRQMIRTTRDQLIALCALHHQGARSLHSGDLRIEPETEAGTDGRCVFWETDEQRGWIVAGVN